MRFPLLDPLRGAAAVWVFLHHLGHASGGPTPAAVRVGYLGVPMFFVISGYCLAAAGRRAVRDGDSTGRFLFRRGLRIFPPFWAAVAVAVGVYAAVPLLGAPVTTYEEFLRTGWAELGAGGWVGLVTMTGGLAPTDWLLWEKTAVVNLAFWTLAIEVQFYLVVGLAVRARQNFYRVLAAATLLSLPFLASAGAFRTGWFLPYWPMFALGVGLYAAVERQQSAGTKSGRWASVLVGAGLGGLGLATAPEIPAGGVAMMLPEVAFALGFALVLWGLRPIGRGEPIGGVAGYLGRVSYSLYLLHVPLMVLVGHAVSGWASPGTVPFAVAVTVGVCGLVYPFYRWVEKPCMSQASRSPRRAAA